MNWKPRRPMPIRISKAAFARLQQARADTRIARADLFPQLNGQASALRARTSPNCAALPAGLPDHRHGLRCGGRCLL